MTKVEINKNTSDEAKAVAEEVKECVSGVLSKDYDWEHRLLHRDEKG